MKDETEEQEKPAKKTKKEPTLKQYIVSGAPPGARKVRKAAFILETCAKFAGDEFRRRFPDCVVWSTGVAAESRLTKKDVAGRDLWADGGNWILIDRQKDDDPLPDFRHNR